MSGVTPNFFRVSKGENPLEKLTGITAVKQGIKSSKGKTPGIHTPTVPDPFPTPIPGREEEEAKKKVKKRARGGRQQNILAGRLMAQRGNILKTRLG